MFEFPAGGTGFTGARDRDVAYPEFVQLGVHRRVPVAAISGYGRGRTAGTLCDTCDRGRQLRCIRRVTDLDGVVEDDSVSVVDDLGLVAKLHRFTEPTLADRAGVDVMETDHPGRGIRHHSGQSAAGLRHHSTCALQQRIQVVDRSAQLATAPAGRGAQGRRALRSTAWASRIVDSAIPASSPVIRSTAAWPSSRAGAAQTQLGRDRAGPLPCGATAVAHPGAGRSSSGPRYA